MSWTTDEMFIAVNKTTTAHHYLIPLDVFSLIINQKFSDRSAYGRPAAIQQSTNGSFR